MSKYLPRSRPPPRRMMWPTQQKKARTLLQLQRSQRPRRVWTVKCRSTSLPHLLLAHHRRPPHLHHLHHQSRRPHLFPQHHLPHLPHMVLALHRLHRSHNQLLGNWRNNRNWKQRRRTRTGKTRSLRQQAQLWCLWMSVQRLLRTVCMPGNVSPTCFTENRANKYGSHLCNDGFDLRTAFTTRSKQ